MTANQRLIQIRSIECLLEAAQRRSNPTTHIEAIRQRLNALALDLAFEVVEDDLREALIAQAPEKVVRIGRAAA